MQELVDVEAQGRQYVRDGALRQLRAKLKLTRGAMADLLQTDIMTYTAWEANPGVRLWRATAARIGRFMAAAQRSMDLLAEQGIELSALYPIHIAATMEGVPQEVLLSWVRSGTVSHEDLGVLGVWIYRDSL